MLPLHGSRASTAMRIPEPDTLQRLCDERGRPRFLWDLDLTMAQFCARLDDPDPAVRGWMLGRLLREARPEDALAFVTPQDIRDAWPQVQAYLGAKRSFWAWLLDVWREAGRVHD